MIALKNLNAETVYENMLKQATGLLRKAVTRVFAFFVKSLVNTTADVVAEIPKDYRYERAVKTFDLPNDKIAALYKEFTRMDAQNAGYVV